MLQRRRRETNKLCLPAEDEQKIADWFGENPIFFNRAMRDYKDGPAKQDLANGRSGWSQCQHTLGNNEGGDLLER